tara:strand:- start:681 stop:839 length:159 start_codon:yes stop_codon:yes gene_type:complete
MDFDDLITFICDNFDLDEVIEALEDVLAEDEEYWTDEELEYEVDEEGFYSLK